MHVWMYESEVRTLELHEDVTVPASTTTNDGKHYENFHAILPSSIMPLPPESFPDRTPFFFRNPEHQACLSLNYAPIYTWIADDFRSTR